MASTKIPLSFGIDKILGYNQQSSSLQRSKSPRAQSTSPPCPQTDVQESMECGRCSPENSSPNHRLTQPSVDNLPVHCSTRENLTQMSPTRQLRHSNQTGKYSHLSPEDREIDVEEEDAPDVFLDDVTGTGDTSDVTGRQRKEPEVELPSLHPAKRHGLREGLSFQKQTTTAAPFHHSYVQRDLMPIIPLTYPHLQFPFLHPPGLEFPVSKCRTQSSSREFPVVTSSSMKSVNLDLSSEPPVFKLERPLHDPGCWEDRSGVWLEGRRERVCCK